jgi:hypothetical protein
MSDQEKSIKNVVKNLRDAADQLEKKGQMSPEEAEQAVGELQSCCGTCTLVSAVPPCQNTCIKVSPLFG